MSGLGRPRKARKLCAVEGCREVGKYGTMRDGEWVMVCSEHERLMAQIHAEEQRAG